MRDALRNARAAALLLRGSARFAAAWALDAVGSRHAEAMGLRGLDDGLDAFELLGANAIAAYLRTMDPRADVSEYGYETAAPVGAGDLLVMGPDGRLRPAVPRCYACLVRCDPMPSYGGSVATWICPGCGRCTADGLTWECAS